MDVPENQCVFLLYEAHDIDVLLFPGRYDGLV
jgi:hypothetical protein